jgi:hypothetical protein
MVVSFNWYKYSVVIGFLRKGVKTAAIPGPVKSRPPGKCGLFDKFGPPGKCELSEKCEPDQDFFHLANEAKIELKIGIRKSAIKKEGKWELLLSIRRLLAHYTALTAPQAYPFRVAINNTIITETAKYCSIHLNSEELLSVWRDAGTFF